jgi:putative transposase
MKTVSCDASTPSPSGGCRDRAQAPPAFRPGLKRASIRPLGRMALRTHVGPLRSYVLVLFGGLVLDLGMKKTRKRPHPDRELYWTGAHTTHRLRYHLVWIPKYRKRVLTGPVAARLEALLHQACEVSRWGLEEMSVQPDHVHLLVQARPSETVSEVVQRLKGGTSRVIRAESSGPSSRISTSPCGGTVSGPTGTLRRRWARWTRRRSATTFANSALSEPRLPRNQNNPGRWELWERCAYKFC